MTYPVRHTFSSLRPEILREFLSPMFVETGTNTGEGIQAALDAGFEAVVSCELDVALCAAAVRRFTNEPDRVDVRRGSSPGFLRHMLRAWDEPLTIYLDAHSAEHNPLLDELAAIADAPCKAHTILIDDVRMFGTPEWFGIGLPQIAAALRRVNPAYTISYRDTNHAPGDLLVAQIKGTR